MAKLNWPIVSFLWHGHLINILHVCTKLHNVIFVYYASCNWHGLSMLALTVFTNSHLQMLLLRMQQFFSIINEIIILSVYRACVFLYGCTFEHNRTVHVHMILPATNQTSTTLPKWWCHG